MSHHETSISPHDRHRHRRRHHDHDRSNHPVSIRADSRSRSPTREGSCDGRHRYRRSRQEDARSHRQQQSSEGPAAVLPLGAVPLSKRDLSRYKAMFGTYLDIQKGIYIDDLDDRELRGRWKSFVGKWNRGELAEGWYDPATLKKALEGAYSRSSPDTTVHDPRGRRASASYKEEQQNAAPNEYHQQGEQDKGEEDEEEEEESYGPQAPSSHRQLSGYRPGPKIPTLADLTIKREDEQFDLEQARKANKAIRKQELSSHKSELRKIEDEIAPRAEPGSRERLLEKKREKSASNRQFAEARRGGSPVEAVADADLMGGAEGEDGFKKLKEKQMRKKNERELRKEEILRARAEEREIRLRSYRRKEDETMDYLRAIAQERFG
ncbi:hypothetical protein MGYG_01229 [Nannizzia gypsea CBS 118893]|uniref:RNA helicase HEL117 n=1 Tax=Arthroderma gypseum (strain ATCC MYA-4604 / CBS 118893) TaxID=535722 RepID=E5QZP2_ARTGP|nr:hypothetical protein MGYG_01229 [Nannizzia gypsea CBS 118893]EFQ98193.1 hypothetical protein MGYG_01229 [Nannizzia gypsea CBS 118893]